MTVQNHQGEEERRREHWRQTRRLALRTIGWWLFAAIGIHLIILLFEPITIFGFTLSFYMAAQGSLLLFILIIFAFSKAQDRIDRIFGMAEEE